MRPAVLRPLAAGLVLACLACLPARAGAQASALEVGIVPYLPTSHLIGTFHPLATFLEQRLNRPVNLSTAPDIRTHLERSLRREYALLITGPSPGRLAQKDAGYVPLLVSRRNVQALILVRQDSSLTSAAQLRGKRIASWEPMSATAQLGDEMLRQAKIDPGRDAALVQVKTPYNAAQAASLGEADAAIVPVQLLPALPEDMKARLRIIARSRELPGVMILALASAGLPKPAEMRRLLLEFFETEPAGRTIVAKLEYDGFLPPGELTSLDSLLPDMRRRLDK